MIERELYNQAFTMEQRCAVVAIAWNHIEKPTKPITSDDVWKMSPSGELFPIFDLWDSVIEHSTTDESLVVVEPEIRRILEGGRSE